MTQWLTRLAASMDSVILGSVAVYFQDDGTGTRIQCPLLYVGTLPLTRTGVLSIASSMHLFKGKRMAIWFSLTY